MGEYRKEKKFLKLNLNEDKTRERRDLGTILSVKKGLKKWLDKHAIRANYAGR